MLFKPALIALSTLFLLTAANPVLPRQGGGPGGPPDSASPSTGSPDSASPPPGSSSGPASPSTGSPDSASPPPGSPVGSAPAGSAPAGSSPGTPPGTPPTGGTPGTPPSGSPGSQTPPGAGCQAAGGPGAAQCCHSILPLDALGPLTSVLSALPLGTLPIVGPMIGSLGLNCNAAAGGAACAGPQTAACCQGVALPSLLPALPLPLPIPDPSSLGLNCLPIPLDGLGALGGI